MVKFKLGCDPEFIVVKNGELVKAHSIYQQDESLGTDGNSDVAEIRPGTADTPLELISKIGALLQYAYEEYPDLEGRAGAMALGYPIGGHIHLSTGYTKNLEVNLEYLIGNLQKRIYPETEVLQRLQSYGTPFEIREKEYGIEYRAPVSWLTGPAIALAYISLAKIAGIHKEICLPDKAGYNGWNWLDLLNNIDIPEDCKEGVELIPELLEMPYEEWDDDIFVNWGMKGDDN